LAQELSSHKLYNSPVLSPSGRCCWCREVLWRWHSCTSGAMQ